MITMFDSVDVSQLPHGQGYAYAGYVNGRFQTYRELLRMFPGHDVLSIAVTADADAACLDVETGDASIPQVAEWVVRQLARGVSRPCIYSSVSQMGMAINAIHAVSAASLSRVRIWTAHYTKTRHICGPRTCGQLAVSADGTQWTDTSRGLNLDESVLLDNFFGGSPVHGGGGTTDGSAVPAWEVSMMNALPTLQLGSKDDKTPWFVRRMQALCNVVVPAHKIAVDGDFGPATQDAVKAVQARFKLTADGIVGPATWAVLVTGAA